MELVVGSAHLAADIAVALDVSGREHLVIATKATWAIPGAGQRPRPLQPQPLMHADVYAGAPGESAMLYGSDFARFKPRCDVLFNACAHSADGQPVTELLVAWQVGPLRKGLRAVGPRRWQRTLGLVSLSASAPFKSMPLHYGLAFGGTLAYQRGSGDAAQLLADALLDNPAGIGWAGPHTQDGIDGASAPSLEALDDPVRSPRAKHKPMAFSAVGRHWLPRRQYAGTYDAAWQRNVFPFLPQDFDERFHQCAPEDQQMPYPQGGEKVVLHHMVAGRADVRFTLPPLNTLAVRVLRTDYSSETLAAVADTLYFEPDADRFSVVWRASTPIRRRLQEFGTLAVGPVDSAWWANKVSGGDGSGCADCDDEPAQAEGLA
jgi:hypothetical protein